MARLLTIVAGSGFELLKPWLEPKADENTGDSVSKEFLAPK
jgi:hypothetical protein